MPLSEGILSDGGGRGESEHESEHQAPKPCILGLHCRSHISARAPVSESPEWIKNAPVMTSSKISVP